MKMLQHTYPTIYLLLFATAASAQIGSGWIEYKPVRKIHLVDFTYKGHPKGMYSFDWKAKAEVGSPTPCSGYEYDPVTDTETFRLYDNRANRSEIRLENEYGCYGTLKTDGAVVKWRKVKNFKDGTDLQISSSLP